MSKTAKIITTVIVIGVIAYLVYRYATKDKTDAKVIDMPGTQNQAA